MNATLLDRRRFVAELLREVPDALVVTGLGSPTYDVHATGHAPGRFHLWGAMGGAVPLALGLALARPERAVLCITGDGEQLMGLGSLATVAVAAPPNLTVVVLDNGHFGETGMQRSHTGLGADLVAVARACGIADAEHVRDHADVVAVAGRVTTTGGPAFRQVHITTDEPPRALPPRDGAAAKNDFRSHLGLETF